MRAAIGLLLLAAAAVAQATTDVPLGRAGTLRIPSIEGMARVPAAGKAATLVFAADKAPRAMLMLTPIPLNDGFIADAEIRRMVEAGVDAVRAQSVQKEFPLVELRGAQARGHYFAATDRAPRPGEFSRLMQGAVVVDAVLVSFTLLYDDGADAMANAALEAVRALRLRGAGDT